MVACENFQYRQIEEAQKSGKSVYALNWFFSHIKTPDKVIMTECEEALEEKYHSESVRTEILIRLEKSIKSGISDKLKGWSTLTEKAERLSVGLGNFWFFVIKNASFKLNSETFSEQVKKGFLSLIISPNHFSGLKHEMKNMFY